MPGPFGPGGVPISGFAMLQHQIKAVHESAHQEEKQRQDQGDLERRPPFNTRSPTILDRDGKRTKHFSSCSHLCPVHRSISLVLVAASSMLFIVDAFLVPKNRKRFEGDPDCHRWFCLCQRKKVEAGAEVCTGALHDVAE